MPIRLFLILLLPLLLISCGKKKDDGPPSWWKPYPKWSHPCKDKKERRMLEREILQVYKYKLDLTKDLKEYEDDLICNQFYEFREGMKILPAEIKEGIKNMPDFDLVLTDKIIEYHREFNGVFIDFNYFYNRPMIKVHLYVDREVLWHELGHFFAAYHYTNGEKRLVLDSYPPFVKIWENDSDREVLKGCYFQKNSAEGFAEAFLSYIQEKVKGPTWHDPSLSGMVDFIKKVLNDPSFFEEVKKDYEDWEINPTYKQTNTY